VRFLVEDMMVAQGEEAHKEHMGHKVDFQEEKVYSSMEMYLEDLMVLAMDIESVSFFAEVLEEYKYQLILHILEWVNKQI
jgi:hypothetical protein